jgi:hypothetical protein
MIALKAQASFERAQHMRLINAGLAALLIAGAASIATATEAFADSPPLFTCTNPKTGDTHQVPSNEKSAEIKNGYYRCEKVLP